MMAWFYMSLREAAQVPSLDVKTPLVSSQLEGQQSATAAMTINLIPDRRWYTPHLEQSDRDRQSSGSLFKT